MKMAIGARWLQSALGAKVVNSIFGTAGSSSAISSPAGEPPSVAPTSSVDWRRTNCGLAALGVVVIAGLAASPGYAEVCPGPIVVDGIDVSYWQSTIDWAKVKASGKKYAIMRAAHAMKADTKFDYNWKQCHAVGLHCGVYQYFEPAEDPIKQADLLLSMMGKLGPGDLPPVIDVESKTGSTPANTAAAVGKWIAHVEKAVGRKPMIYTGYYFWKDNVGSNAFASYPLWHAQYCTQCCPKIAVPWTKWHFWQHSSTGSVSGISGNVDLNRWDGTTTALAAFAVAAVSPSCTAKCEGSVAVQSSCAKTDCAAAAGTCVADSLGVRCISKYCPAQGKTQVCLPGGIGQIGACDNGKISTGDCGAFGAFCSTAVGSAAKCVSAFCASGPTAAPVAKHVCLPDGQRYSCNAQGDIALLACPADTTCADKGAGAQCLPKSCTAKCEGNSLVSGDCTKKDCGAIAGLQAGFCIDDSKGARCISKMCPPTGLTAVCLPDPKQVATGICKDGVLTPATCKLGLEVCQEIPGGSVCTALPQDDAGSTGPDGASTADGGSQADAGSADGTTADSAGTDADGLGAGSADSSEVAPNDAGAPTGGDVAVAVDLATAASADAFKEVSEEPADSLGTAVDGVQPPGDASAPPAAAAPRSPVDGGCSTRARGQSVASLALLAAVAVTLRRRRLES